MVNCSTHDDPDASASRTTMNLWLPSSKMIIMSTPAILDRTRVSAVAASLGGDAVLILDTERCDHSPRLLQELEVLTSLGARSSADDHDDDDRPRGLPSAVLSYMDIRTINLNAADTWIPGVPILVTMDGVSVGIQAASEAKLMIENGCELKRIT
jgi:hypothetical protein